MWGRSGLVFTAAKCAQDDHYSSSTPRASILLVVLSLMKLLSTFYSVFFFFKLRQIKHDYWLDSTDGNSTYQYTSVLYHRRNFFPLPLPKFCSSLIHVSFCVGPHPCTPRHTWSLEWGEYVFQPVVVVHLLPVRLQRGDSPGFLFQETHAVREPDRLQDIRAQQETTELDRGERPVIRPREPQPKIKAVFNVSVDVDWLLCVVGAQQ